MFLPEARSVNRVCFYKMGVPDLCSSTRAVLVTKTTVNTMNNCSPATVIYIYIYTEGSASDIFNSSFHAVNTLFPKKPRWNGDGTWPRWSARGFCFSSIVVKVVLASQRPNWSDNLIFKGYKRAAYRPGRTENALVTISVSSLASSDWCSKGGRKKKKKGQFFWMRVFPQYRFSRHILTSAWARPAGDFYASLNIERSRYC